MEIVSRLERATGAALIEALIAAGLLVALAAGLAPVLAMAVRSNLSARTGTMSAVLAVQKMEQLRSLTWSFSGDGAPLSDRMADLSGDLPADTGSGLAASPSGTLDRNVPPYVDYLDAMGRWVGNGASPPPGALYIRRWAVQPLADDPEGLTLQVLVTTSRAPDKPSGPDATVRLLSSRTRR